MRYKIFFLIMILSNIIFYSNSATQTLYNGVGHILAANQETWTNAGLLNDAPAITPKAVFVVPNMSGTTMDQKVDAAINDSVDLFIRLHIMH